MIRKIYNSIINLGNKIKNDQIAAFSAQAAFFLMLSFFPLLLVICMAIQFLPITKAELISMVDEIMPGAASGLVEGIISGFYEKVSGITAIISGVAAIWSASKGTMAVERGLNFMDDINDKKGYFVRRGINAIYTLIFSAMIILVLGVYILGNSLISKIINYTNSQAHADVIMLVAKLITGPVVVFGVILLILYRLPDTKHSFMSCLPGAVAATIGWILIAAAFSVYVDYSKGYSYMYGSLAGIALTMLWLYVCMYILFLGAELNAFLRDGLLTRLKDMLKCIGKKKR
jgi:membrane protein